MTPQEKADKEMEVIAWMNKKCYDRKASQEIAPIIVECFSDNVVKNISQKKKSCKYGTEWYESKRGRICADCGVPVKYH